MKNIILEKTVIFLFFFIFLLVGLSIFKDYGISIDEDNTRIVGFLSLEYILNHFSFFENKVEISNLIKENAGAHPKDEISTSGIVFDLPMAFVEYFYGIKDSRNYFLLRHLVTFLIFFSSTFFFFLLLKNKFKSVFYALLGTSFLIISPRIFANSFYNSKDIIFMSLFIISLFYSLRFLKSKDILNGFILSIIYALAINLRIIGIIFPIILTIFYLIKILMENRNYKNKILNYLFFITSLVFTIYLITPELWVDTVDSFLKLVLFLKSHFLKIYVFYLGNFYLISNVPWHYHIVWIASSTPIIYVIFFLIGLFLILRRFINRLFKIEKNDSYKDLWRGESELDDLFFTINFLVPLIILTDSGMISYNGWRHLFFIYPVFLLISLSGVNRIQYFFSKEKIKYFRIFLIFTIFPNLIWMIKNHPYQNLYFNSLAKINFEKNFEADFWGLTNKQALEKILKKDKDEINVYALSTSDLKLSKKILKKIDRDRINVVYNIQEADYLIDTHYSWKGERKIKDKLSEFNIFNEIKIEGISVNTIYKKKLLE